MDIIDRGQALAEQHLEYSLAAHAASLKTNAAEIVDGDAFICIDCTDAIPAARVAVLKSANRPALRCLHCQQTQERK